MWINCEEVLLDVDKVDYIAFGYEEVEEFDVPTAYVYFTGREEPLLLHAGDFEELQGYFHTLIWSDDEKTE